MKSFNAKFGWTINETNIIFLHSCLLISIPNNKIQKLTNETPPTKLGFPVTRQLHKFGSQVTSQRMPQYSHHNLMHQKKSFSKYKICSAALKWFPLLSNILIQLIVIIACILVILTTTQHQQFFILKYSISDFINWSLHPAQHSPLSKYIYLARLGKQTFDVASLFPSTVRESFNWLEVKPILPACFDNLEESVSYREGPVQNNLPATRTNKNILWNPCG